MTFQARLRSCMERGNLTIADLARWLERPHATVSTWVNDGRVPGGPPATLAWVEVRLTRLEEAIETATGFPIPAHLAHRARAIYLKRLKNGRR